MFYYAVKRACLGLLIVIIAVSALFFMIHLVPGDPANVILGPRATPELKAALNERMGLNKPMLIQLAIFFKNIATGNLGTDVFTEKPVLETVMSQLPYTVVLIFAGILWSALIGIPLGCYAAIKRNSILDRITGFISVGTIAIPSFVVSLYSLLFFSVMLKWFPAIGAGDSGDFKSQFMHLVLPAFSIGLGWVGYLSRIVRASMLEVLNEDHIRTARAFGLPEHTIVFRYALKIAVLPAITMLGVGMGYLLSGALFAEIVFARPGIGKLIYDAVLTRNYPVVMGSVFVSTAFFVLSTTIADLVNAMLDSRIRRSM